MAGNTIGQFISVLRRARGMTQQEMADRLNVSNKAVSRWERDECAPDITLIPAIAEMFGISCDELLKGERIFNDTQEIKSEPKVEKQIRSLVNRGIWKFKVFIYIALALSAVGFILMMGIAYGFYRPRIGFAVMMLFEVSSFFVTLIGMAKLREISVDNELFESVDEKTVSVYYKTLSDMSYFAFFSVISAAILSLPHLLVNSEFIFSVLSFGSYMGYAFILILCLISLYIALKGAYASFITGKSYIKESLCPSVRLMNIIQVSSVTAAAFLVVISPYAETYSKFGSYEDINSTFYIALNILAICLMVGILLCFATFAVKYREERKGIFFYGIRNILFIPSVLLIAEFHYVSYTIYASVVERHDGWSEEYLIYALGWFLLVYTVFSVMSTVNKKKGIKK
ncbi:MAG: helix-turn-helix transcriptional regulator [Ruminococcaceae bacterium]|nr:helix-turn-helix transcriptional regulator [Oscillospiraceae bacterium]